MPKFMFIPILVCPMLMACGPCADTDSCAEEWAEKNEEDKFLHPETCQDQAKYDECVEYYRYVPTSPDFSVSSYCYKQAEIRCVDRKSSSSSKNKWWH